MNKFALCPEIQQLSFSSLNISLWQESLNSDIVNNSINVLYLFSNIESNIYIYIKNKNI
jgi:hypothetical protein